MCGIIGVIGQNAPQKAFEGLKALEYRGYDSWGIAAPASAHASNGSNRRKTTESFYVEKHVGKIGESRLDSAPEASIALGHTRWATHGRVLEKNAHPHLSMRGKVAVVHNGIVENFSKLKKDLIARGFTFRSDTDSEVIANLIEESMGHGKTLEDAVRAAVLQTEGSYAIAVIGSEQNLIVCAKNGSPLVLGLMENGAVNEFFVASDATAFISRTNKAVFLEDNQMVVLSPTGVQVFSTLTGKKAPFKTKTLLWSAEQAGKNGFAHFMLKEISEQPQTILLASEQPTEMLTAFVDMAKKAEKIFLLGCGSSHHAAITGSYLFSGIAGIDARPVLASEFGLVSNFVDSTTLVIGITQSGETADLIGALKDARAKGAKIASIVNVMDSTVMRLSDCSLLMNAGPEICVLSTKSYTSQLSALFLIAHALVGKEADAKNLLRCASDAAGFVIGSHAKSLAGLAKKISSAKDIFVIGRGESFPSALEAALKIKEVSYIHAEGFAGAELKHGTIALIEEGTPAIVLSTPSAANLTLSNAIEMRSRGAFIIGVAPENSDAFDFFIEAPDCGAANPIIQVIPIQLLAYYLALERGCDVDHPKNLAKSVTVR